jgi:steroid delta-isomerase-like uncharacterized protein
MKTLLKLSIPAILLFSLTLKVHSQNDPEQVKNGIMKVYDIFNSYSFDKLGDYVDDNFIEHSPDPGQKQGLSGLKEEFENLHKGFPDYKMTVNDIIISSAGDKASVLFTWTGTNTGEMMGMKPTNKPVNVQGIDYLYFKNGKATEHWGYMDMNKMMQQLGMMPPPSDNTNPNTNTK